MRAGECAQEETVKYKRARTCIQIKLFYSHLYKWQMILKLRKVFLVEVKSGLLSGKLGQKKEPRV